ncbi:hypothetical protein A3K63_02505 [Candidatus Micrarchaeota archaeon RBG_16_49_10]|nr:MAG: hypothetical protein A3K63_02505 [Candidatus Micrarchaeota archaeon RBG_16_49_10]
MPYKIPKDWDVIRAIEHVLKQRGFVTSGEELGYLVLRRLKEVNSGFVATPDRVRRVAITIPEVEIRVKTRHSDAKKLKGCPVCGWKITKAYRRNLGGQRVHTGYRCEKCGFRTNRETLAPGKYLFLWKKKL